MEKINFYDVKAREKFSSSKYEIKTRLVKGKKRKFAVSTSPLTEIKCWRVL